MTQPFRRITMTIERSGQPRPYASSETVWTVAFEQSKLHWLDGELVIKEWVPEEIKEKDIERAISAIGYADAPRSTPRPFGHPDYWVDSAFDMGGGKVQVVIKSLFYD